MKSIMPRAAAALLALAMLLSLCGCGAKKDKDKEDASEEPVQTAEPLPTAAPTPTAEPSMEMNIGPVSVSANAENGVSAEIALEEGSGTLAIDDGDVTVTATLPAALVGADVTQESLDEGGEFYTSAVLNEDGSVTYTMTTEQYSGMLSSVAETIEQQVAAVLKNDAFQITEIAHNDDFTVFDVTVSGSSVGLMASVAALALYTSGGLYNAFTGNAGADITVNFLSPDGTVLETGHSSEAGE